ncbi:hypothetical protein MY10362_005624 [Beauveria mimosiformis]
MRPEYQGSSRETLCHVIQTVAPYDSPYHDHARKLKSPGEYRDKPF